MFPARPATNTGYMPVANAKKRSYILKFFAGLSHPSYRNDVHAREFRVINSLSPRMRSVDRFMPVVLFGCHPFKICSDVVPAVAVKVGPLVANRTRTYKCFKHQTMNVF